MDARTWGICPRCGIGPALLALGQSAFGVPHSHRAMATEGVVIIYVVADRIPTEHHMLGARVVALRAKLQDARYNFVNLQFIIRA